MKAVGKAQEETRKQVSGDSGKPVETLSKSLLLAREVTKALGMEISGFSDSVSPEFEEVGTHLNALVERFDTLSESGIDMGAVLGAALEKSLGKAKNPADLTVLVGKIEQLDEAGRLAKPKMIELLDAVREKAKGVGGPSGDECQNLIVVHGSQDPEFFRDAAHPFGRNNGQENIVLTRRSESVPETASTLTRNYGRQIDNTASNVIVHPQAAVPGMSVRRLTPRECERLMGFSDHYTRIEWRGATAEKCPNTPRYEALGNSMAVPVMRWIGQKIDTALVYQATANEPQRKLLDDLRTTYKKGTGLEPSRERSDLLVIDALIGLLAPGVITDVINQIEAFLTDKSYLFDRIRERSGRQRFFRQAAVLLAYFLADRMPSQTRDLWLIESKDLALVFSDLGVRFQSHT